jgi:hypothetical protein
MNLALPRDGAYVLLGMPALMIKVTESISRARLGRKLEDSLADEPRTAWRVSWSMEAESLPGWPGTRLEVSIQRRKK